MAVSRNCTANCSSEPERNVTTARARKRAIPPFDVGTDTTPITGSAVPEAWTKSPCRPSATLNRLTSGSAKEAPSRSRARAIHVQQQAASVDQYDRVLDEASEAAHVRPAKARRGGSIREHRSMARLV